jgi:hypothetical protein
MAQLSGDEDRSVAGAATGYQRAESTCEVAPPAEAVVIDLPEDVRTGDGDNTRVLGGRIPRREWIGFIQVSNLRQVIVSHGCWTPGRVASSAAGSTMRA